MLLLCVFGMVLMMMMMTQVSGSTRCVPLRLSEYLPLCAYWDDANDCSTPLLQDWLGDDKEKRFRREVHFPTGRFGEAIEQAHAVIFLASDESSFVNAADFVVDGGLTKAYVTPEGPATEAPKNLGQ